MTWPAPRPDVWLHPGVERRSSPIDGGGLFAIAPIQASELVVRLGGRLVDGDELARLLAASGTYVDAISVDEDRHLVLPSGSGAHFGNHSCDPTLWIGGPYEVVTRVDVGPGDELTLDYATVSGAPGFRMDCRCGAAGCRSEVTSEDWQRPELQARYRGHWVPALRRRIADAASG